MCVHSTAESLFGKLGSIHSTINPFLLSSQFAIAEVQKVSCGSKYDFEEPILTMQDAYDNNILFSANALSRYPSINTRSEGGEGEMRSAIKYLQDLDDFYSQIARPR